MANALESASLVMIPSGYEDGTLGSLKPTDGTGDFTFSRGSDISATRISADGYIEKGYENLLLQSNSFDTTWSQVGSFNILGGQQGYDSSNNAWSIESNSTAFDRRIQQSLSLSGVHTFSVYAKSNSTDWILFYNGTDRVYFDLANGVVGSSQSGLIIDSKIEPTSVTGWYRCTATFNRGISFISVVPASGDGNSNVLAGNSIYIQDAMLNQGLVAYPYRETTTAPVAGGILEDMPRLDYSNGSCPALLLEPQRTNLFPHSEYIDQWQLVNIGTEISNTLSPDGASPMTKAIFTNQGLNSYIRQNRNMDSGSIAVSIFVKKGLIDSYASIRIEGIDNNISVWFNLDNGTIGSETGSPTNKSIVSYGNGIYRISATTTSTTDLSFQTKIQSADTDGGYPTENATQFYWGGQAEQGSYPTSYIPTYGVSQTRLADSIENPIESQPLGQIGQGTWFVELQKLGDDISSSLYLVPTLSNTQQIRLHFDASNARFRDAVNGYATIGGGVNIKTSITKMALSIDTNLGIAKTYANGSQLGADYTLQSNTFEFSRIKADGNGFILKQSSFFPTALTDSECIELTTI